MSEKPPKLNKPFRQLSYDERKINKMTKIQLMEYVFIDPKEYDPTLVTYNKVSARENIKECKKDLMHLKEHLQMCPIAKTIYKTIFQVREALRSFGFNTLEAVAAVELAYRYSDEDSDETNEFFLKRPEVQMQPKTREPTISRSAEIDAALEKVDPPEHIGQMRYINETDVKGNIRKGVTRVFENWLDAVNEALYTPRAFIVHGSRLVGARHPILMYLELEYAPINIPLMRKYDPWDKEWIEKFVEMAKVKPEEFIL